MKKKLNLKNLFRTQPKETEITSSAKEPETAPEIESTCCAAPQKCDSDKSPKQPAQAVKRKIPEPGWEEDELYE